MPIQTLTVADKTEIITTEESTQEDNVKYGGNNLWWLWLVLAGIVIEFIIFIILKNEIKPVFSPVPRLR